MARQPKIRDLLLREKIASYLDDADDTYGDAEFLELHGLTLEQAKKCLEDFAIYSENVR